MEFKIKIFNLIYVAFKNANTLGITYLHFMIWLIEASCIIIAQPFFCFCIVVFKYVLHFIVHHCMYILFFEHEK